MLSSTPQHSKAGASGPDRSWTRLPASLSLVFLICDVGTVTTEPVLRVILRVHGDGPAPPYPRGPPSSERQQQQQTIFQVSHVLGVSLLLRRQGPDPPPIWPAPSPLPGLRGCCLPDRPSWLSVLPCLFSHSPSSPYTVPTRLSMTPNGNCPRTHTSPPWPPSPARAVTVSLSHPGPAASSKVPGKSQEILAVQVTKYIPLCTDAHTLALSPQ